MGCERLIGIDFGTSTSVIKVKTYDDRGTPIGQELSTHSVTFNNGASMVPTVVRELNGKFAFGYDAETPQRNAEVYRCFKIGLQSADEAEAQQSKDLVRKYFEYMYKVYEHQRNSGFFGNIEDSDTTIVSYPVKWDSSIREFMISAAEDAGFVNVSGMDEAEAAIQAVTVQCRDILNRSGFLMEGQASNIMLIDMGAGTTDVVICRYTPGSKNTNEILTTWPRGGSVFFGGQEMDSVFKQFIVSRFPEDVREQVNKRISVDSMKAWKEKTVSPALKNHESVRECSEADTVAYWMDINYDDFSLDRDSFEDLFSDYIGQFVRLVSDAVMDSGLTSDQIDLVVLTGGHSGWYFIEEILNGTNTKFGDLNLVKVKREHDRILSVALPQETVALGLVYSKIAGKLSFDKASHLWKTYLDSGSLNALTEAAELGSPDAQNDLAFRYRWADGVPKDEQTARVLFNKAADQGHRLALHNLGCWELQEARYSSAFEYFKKAATKGVAEAHNNLAICYRYGLGTDKSPEKALEHFKKSFDLGYTPAKATYDSYYRELNPGSGPSPIDINTDDVVEYARSIDDISSPTLRSFYFCDSIPSAKLDKFMTNFGDRNLTGQRIICYYDDTWFDSGKHGFLLTDKRLYWHTFLNTARVCELSNISKVFINTNGKLIVSMKNGFSDWIPSGTFTSKLEAFLSKILFFINDNN